MSGKRIWNGTNEEYRVLHEQEMRQRFMQQDIPGITAPAYRPVVIPSLMPATLQVIRNWPEANVGKVRPRFEGIMTVAKAPVMWFQQAARFLARRFERAGFRLAGYDARQTAVTMQRGAERITIMLIEAAPISTISRANGEWESGSDVVVGQRGDESTETVASARDQRSGHHRA